MTTGRIPSIEGGIQPTIFDAKGDLIVATAADTPAALTVGANGTVLTAASGEATGLTVGCACCWWYYGGGWSPIAGGAAIDDLVIATTAGSFNAGTVKIYGVK
jgi:hypothetical protein